MISRKRKNVMGSKDENSDRISELPESILAHILSYLNTTSAIRSCILSKRWVSMWKSLPSLILCEEIPMSQLINLIQHVIDHRYAVDLREFELSHIDDLEHQIVERLIRYVVEHNVREVRISGFWDEHTEFPQCFFTSKSLMLLELETFNLDRLPTLLGFPALKILELCYFTFPAQFDGNLFSNCPNLEKLTLSKASFLHTSCRIRTPKLRHLKISIRSPCDFAVDAPLLTYFKFRGKTLPKFSMCDDLPFLNRAIVDVHGLKFKVDTDRALCFTNMLKKFRNARDITLSMQALEAVSKGHTLLEDDSLAFCNVKCIEFKVYRDIKIYPAPMPAKVLMYLLKNSPGATILWCYREKD